jgi:hypothetical protein
LRSKSPTALGDAKVHDTGCQVQLFHCHCVGAQIPIHPPVGTIAPNEIPLDVRRTPCCAIDDELPTATLKTFDPST